MGNHAESPDGTAPNLPVVFIVDAGQESRVAMETALRRRFALDYRIVAADSAEAGLAALDRLSRDGAQVALVAADLRLPEIDGVDFLGRAQLLHPGARRMLLVAMDQRGTRIPLDDLEALQRVTALGRIDSWVLKGTASPEELVYPNVQQALTTWTRANRPRHEVVRIVGEQWDQRSHDLRDALARNTVPFGFYAVESDIGRQMVQEHGIGGGERAFRAWEQTLLFGAQFVFIQRATGLSRHGPNHIITLTDGSEAVARAVIISVGVDYRRLGIPDLERLNGVGVFYGAATVEAPALAGDEVYVVGGANSAGQAALYLARFASQVTLLVRGESLAASMSDYLIQQIAATPNVAVRLRTEVVDGRGQSRLEALVLKEVGTDRQEEVPAAAVFIMIGAEPRTAWLPDELCRDDRGFILTDREVTVEWPAGSRAPLPFETSLPGVFAVGDVRHGSVKRVASAVGEGSVAVGSVHQYLAITATSASGKQ